MNKLKLFLTVFMLCNFLFIFACNEKKIEEKENFDLKLISCLDNGEFEEAKSIIEKSEIDGNFIYKNIPVLGYVVSNDMTDLALLLLDKTSDIKTVEDKLKNPLFETVIRKENLILEKALLQKGVDLSYRNVRTGSASYLDMCLELKDGQKKEDIIKLFLGFDYVRNYFCKNNKTLFSIIWRWSEKSPEYIEMIYGKDFKVPNDIPVLHYSITNMNAIRYFIAKGADVHKDVSEENSDYWGTPLEYALYVRDLLEKPELDGIPDNNIEQRIENINMIIEYLQRLP